jgi:signal transduction histidine kinase
MAGHETRVLHVPTLIFVVGLINFLQACAFWIVGFHNRQVKGLGWWAAAAFCNGVAMPLIAFRQLTDSALPTKLLPATMNFASAYLFYVGAVRFRECGTVRRWPLVAALPFYGVFAWLILNDEGLRYRAAFTSPIFILFQAMGAWELLRETRPALRFSARFTAYAALFISTVFTYRAIDLYFLSSPAELLDPVRPQVVSFTGGILWAVLWTFGAQMMINQRQTFENGRLHAEKLRKVEELAAAQSELMALRTLQHRQELASDLHDGFGSITANLAMLAFQGSIEDKPRQQKALFQDIEFLATEWNRELRLWMNGVERGNLRWGDVLAEARSYAERLTAAKGIELHWHLSGRLPAEPDPRVQEMISLMRVLKEAIGNLVRHSEARRARVHVAFRPKLLGIVIQDDGRGFDPADARAGGRGLKIMRRRVEELGGGFKCRGRNGTTLCLTLPLPLQRPGGEAMGAGSPVYQLNSPPMPRLGAV